MELKARATQLEARAAQAEARAVQAEARIIEGQRAIETLLVSSSWRITAPFRYIKVALLRLSAAISERRLISGLKRRIHSMRYMFRGSAMTKEQTQSNIASPVRAYRRAERLKTKSILPCNSPLAQPAFIPTYKKPSQRGKSDAYCD